MKKQAQLKYGDYIRSLRKELKISQQDLAEKVGCSTFIMAKWENNEAFPDVSLLGNLCRELKVDLTSFINCKKSLNNTYCIEKDYSTAVIGDMLEYLRSKKHMSQKTMAGEIEISYKKISRYETGAGIIPFPEFLQFCDYFGIEYEVLYFGLKENLDENALESNPRIITKTRFYEFELVFLGFIFGVAISLLAFLLSIIFS